jgi:hypothetical protein
MLMIGIKMLFEEMRREEEDTLSIASERDGERN